jgi:hypothetical protein
MMRVLALLLAACASARATTNRWPGPTDDEPVATAEAMEAMANPDGAPDAPPGFRLVGEMDSPRGDIRGLLKCGVSHYSCAKKCRKDWVSAYDIVEISN